LKLDFCPSGKNYLPLKFLKLVFSGLTYMSCEGINFWQSLGSQWQGGLMLVEQGVFNRTVGGLFLRLHNF